MDAPPAHPHRIPQELSSVQKKSIKVSRLGGESELDANRGEYRRVSAMKRISRNSLVFFPKSSRVKRKDGAGEMAAAFATQLPKSGSN